MNPGLSFPIASLFEQGSSVKIPKAEHWLFRSAEIPHWMCLFSFILQSNSETECGRTQSPCRLPYSVEVAKWRQIHFRKAFISHFPWLLRQQPHILHSLWKMLLSCWKSQPFPRAVSLKTYSGGHAFFLGGSRLPGAV